MQKDGGPHRLQVNGSTYTLQFEGPKKTNVQSWLRVTDEHGDSIRLAPGRRQPSLLECAHNG